MHLVDPNDKVFFERFVNFFIFVIILLQIYVYIDAIFGKLHIKNEFYYINEKTKLNDGEIVSNKEFTKKYLTFDKNITNAKYTSLDVFLKTKDKLDINFIPKFYIFPYINYGNILEPANRFNKLFVGKYYRFFKLNVGENSLIDQYYHFHFEKNRLVSDKNYDSKLSTNENVFQKIYDQNISNILKSDLKNCKSYPLFASDSLGQFKKIVEFVHKNLDEKFIQILDRYYFHESSFVLVPINEYKLGENMHQIFSQYGYLSIMTISKMMDLFGGFSIVNYEKTMKTFYLLYYIIFVFFIFSYFKKNLERLIYLLILGISLYANTYIFFQYPPGHVPFRHFLDLFLIFIVYKFENYKNKIFLYGLPIAILSILVDKENGMIIWLSLLGMYFISDIIDYLKSKNGLVKIIFRILIILLAGIITVVEYPLAKNPSTKYFLEGFYSFPIHKEFYLVLFAIFLSWIVLLLFWKNLKKLNLLNLYIFSSLYAQLSYFYFVWGGGHAHFIVLLPLYILPWGILFSKFDFRYKRYVSILIIILFSIIYAISLKNFFIAKYNSEKVFKNHKTYEWNFDRAGGFISTISPKSFEDSIKLIDEYDKSKRITMISKYDNILSIFSKKYTTLPFFELRSFIVTDKDFQTTLKAIEKANIIFVDNDIARNFKQELKHPTLWTFILFNEQIEQRIPKLRILKRLFEDVKSHYILIKKGKLISVYKKTS